MSSRSDEFLKDMFDSLHQELAKDYDNADEMWSIFERTCKCTVQVRLGISRGGVSNNKDLTWRDEDVKEQIKDQKRLFLAGFRVKGGSRQIQGIKTTN